MKTPTPVDIHITPHKDYIDQTKAFHDKYDLINFIIATGDKSTKTLAYKTDRTCRFCNRNSEKTTFELRAHLLSKFIGNNILFSDFECDECNGYFSKMETDLSYYLGLSRSIVEPNADRRIPTFVEPGRGLTIQAVPIGNETTIVISRDDPNDGKIINDPTTGITTVKATRHSFVPVRVYRAFLKMGLSLLSDREVSENYKATLDWLMERGTHVMTSGCLLSGYALPLTFNLPAHAFIFKKKSHDLELHTHVMAFYFSNMVIAMPMPLHQNDFAWYDKEEELPLYPPLFTQFTQIDSFKLEAFSEDFTSNVAVKGSEQQISFSIDSRELKDSVAFDSVSGKLEKKEFNPSEIMKIIITRGGASFEDPSVLTQALKRV